MVIISRRIALLSAPCALVSPILSRGYKQKSARFLFNIISVNSSEEEKNICIFKINEKRAVLVELERRKEDHRDTENCDGLRMHCSEALSAHGPALRAGSERVPYR